MHDFATGADGIDRLITPPLAGGRRWSRIWVIAGLVTGLCLMGYAVGFFAAYNAGFLSRNTLRAARLVIPYRPEQERVWVMQSRLLREQPAFGRVTLLGDSLTAGADWRILLPHQSVQNRGLGGETTSGLRARLENGELARVLPVVLVMIGVNDHAKGIPIAETKENLKAIVRMLRGRRIILQSTLLTSFSYSNWVVEDLVRYQRELCATGICTFVDLNPAMSKDGRVRPEMVIDGIHLNWHGYQTWAAQIEPLLDAAAGKGLSSPRPAPAGDSAA